MIIISVLWLSIGVFIMKYSVLFWVLYMGLSWIIFTVIEAKKTTGGKGVNHTVGKRENPFK